MKIERQDEAPGLEPAAGEHPARAPAASTPVHGQPRRTSSWHVLRHRDYALLFWGQLISAAGTQMQVVAVAWQVYGLSHSAVALGALGLVQAVPRLALSLVGGVFADVFDRRRMLMLVNLILACTSAVLAICTLTNVISLPIIYAVVLVSASVSAFEFPTRQAVIPSLVPRAHMPDALALSSVGMQLTAIVGATAGGFVLAAAGVANTYWIDVASYFVVVAALLVMAIPRVPAERRAQVGLGALADGWRFLRAHPIILAVLSLDFCATFFGSPRALLPIYAGAFYHTGAQGLGILLAATSIGAVLLAPLTGTIGRIPRQGLGVVLAILGWGICIVGFGLIPGPLWLGVLFLAGAGAADMVSMVLRGLIVQLTTPDELRGRMSAVNAMFVIGGPMLGQFESGVVAGLFTPQLSVVSGGLACIAATILIAARVPGLLRVRAK